MLEFAAGTAGTGIVAADAGSMVVSSPRLALSGHMLVALAANLGGQPIEVGTVSLKEHAVAVAQVSAAARLRRAAGEPILRAAAVAER